MALNRPLTNFGSLSKRIALNKPQYINIKYRNNFKPHLFLFYLLFFGIRDITLKFLYIIINILLYLLFVKNKVRIKLIIIIWNRYKGLKIGYNNL